jgi:hypothetical protein
MNQTIKKVNQEKVLFMDIEDVRRSKDIDVNSREFELFRKKTRNRETDEYLSGDEVVLEYQKKAALKMCYTKIVCIGVGFIKDNEVHIKSLEGTEEEVIKQFCTIAQSFDYMCFSNGIAFDLPMVINNGYRYFDVCEVLPDRFITSGKKQWNLDRLIDLQEVFKGTHYYASSLDEMCYHFDLPSPKTDLEGSQVSDEYWNNGVEKISKYVKQDVFACVNLFKKMRFEPPFETFLDKNATTTVEPFMEEMPLLQRIYKATNIDENTKAELQKRLSKKKLTKKDREIVEDILISLYIDNTMFSSDKPEIKERKKEEIKTILDEVK